MKVIAILLFLTDDGIEHCRADPNRPDRNTPGRQESRCRKAARSRMRPPLPRFPRDWTKQLAARHEAIVSDHLRIHVFRLRPGDDLLGGIRAYVNANHIQAAVLLSAVGSLTQASIRYANQPEAHIHTGHFEIVSITGTVEEGGEHIHLSIATGQGNMIGGHLMTGCKIYTTGEITLAEIQGVRFTRETDREGSGWDELKVYPAKP